MFYSYLISFLLQPPNHGPPDLQVSVMLALSHYNSSASTFLPHLLNDSVGKVEAEVAVEGLLQPGNLTLAQPTTSGIIVVILSMTLGIFSNIVALFILASAYSRQRRRTKATFLLFATSLVITDFIGHMIPGALVLRLYLSGGVHPEDFNSSDRMCQFLGGSMVFFGLCPLFMGCAMAAERCLGVTKPLLHSSLVTKTRTKICLSVIWLAALCVAMLPCFHLGSYTYQDPGTWCFIKVLSDTEEVDVVFVVLFSGLGLASLAVALVCNTISGLTLVLARLRRQPGSHHSAKSHDIEMVVQLVGIMVTSCICWSPLLVSIRKYHEKQACTQIKIRWQTFLLSAVLTLSLYTSVIHSHKYFHLCHLTRALHRTVHVQAVLDKQLQHCLV